VSGAPRRAVEEANVIRSCRTQARALKIQWWVLLQQQGLRRAERGAESGWGWEVGRHRGAQEELGVRKRAVCPAGQRWGWTASEELPGC